MISKVKLKHQNVIKRVRATISSNTVYVFTNSLPAGIVPEVGDEIILDINSIHLSVISVLPLISEKRSHLDSYALTVEPINYKV